MCEVEVVLPLGHMVRIFIAQREAQPHRAALVVDDIETRQFRLLAAIECEGGHWQRLAGADQPGAVALVEPFGLYASL